MSLGVFGIGLAVASNIYMAMFFSGFGGVFLAVYGVNAFINCFGTQKIIDDKGRYRQLSLKKVATQTFGITLLNPHVYLDTVVVVGGIAGTLTLVDKSYFLSGALIASFIWFFGLGYGARLLSSLFRKQVTWRVLDFIIGCIMIFISLGLFKFFIDSWFSLE